MDQGLTALIIIAVVIIVIIIIAIIIAMNNNNPENSTSVTVNNGIITTIKRQPEYLQHMKVLPASNVIKNDPVPKIIHQIWIGPKPLPKHAQKWQKLCNKYGYEYKLWRDNDVGKLINQKYYDEMKNNRCYPGMADILRYEVVYNHGGLYTDFDMTPVDLPIFDYLPKTGFGISLEHEHINLSAPGLNNNKAIFAANQIIVACPKHPILERVIHSMPVNCESLRSKGHFGAAECTGPYLLTACLFGLFTVIDKNWIMVDGPKPEFHLIEFDYNFY
jgi:mannosyltransferase OCH1-like enzyme